MTVKQLIKGLKKYKPEMRVMQGGAEIKAMRITAIDERYPPTCVVRLIRSDEKRDAWGKP